MHVIDIKSTRARVRKVRELIRSAGNSIGSVHFRKRSDGTKRKMSYRLRVFKPTYASKPKGSHTRKAKADESLMTVFDVNLVRYNRQGRMCGRGDYRTVPLENVERICVNGQIYKINIHGI